MCLFEKVTNRITQLKGELAQGATEEEITEVEARLGVELPEFLKTFLKKHNGTKETTADKTWNFWDTTRITSHKAHYKEEFFIPDNNNLRCWIPR